MPFRQEMPLELQLIVLIDANCLVVMVTPSSVKPLPLCFSIRYWRKLASGKLVSLKTTCACAGAVINKMNNSAVSRDRRKCASLREKS